MQASALVVGMGSVMDAGTGHVMDSDRGSVFVAEWRFELHAEFVAVTVLFVGDVAQFEESVEKHSSVDLDREHSVERSVVVVQAIADQEGFVQSDYCGLNGLAAD